MTRSLRLGKAPARPGAVQFKLHDVLKVEKLPPRPATFGHESLVKTWSMLGNAKYGNCVWAGAGHETMLTNKAAGRTVAFTETGVLSDYSAVTGFSPKDPNSDQGTDMQLAASYRRKTGVVDSKHGRHMVRAYSRSRRGTSIRR